MHLALRLCPLEWILHRVTEDLDWNVCGENDVLNNEIA